MAPRPDAARRRLTQAEWRAAYAAHRRYRDGAPTGRAWYGGKHKPAEHLSLHDVDLRGVKMSDVGGLPFDLRDVELIDCDLGRQDLSGVNCSGAHFDGSDFDGATLDGARLHDANLSGANLDGTSLIGADLTNADLRGALLHGAVADEAQLAGADLRDAVVVESYMARADLLGAHLSDAFFRRVDLSGAQLEASHGEGATLLACGMNGARPGAGLGSFAGARVVGASSGVTWPDSHPGATGPMITSSLVRALERSGASVVAVPGDQLAMMGANFVGDDEAAFPMTPDLVPEMAVIAREPTTPIARCAALREASERCREMAEVHRAFLAAYSNYRKGLYLPGGKPEQFFDGTMETGKRLEQIRRRSDHVWQDVQRRFAVMEQAVATALDTKEASAIDAGWAALDEAFAAFDEHRRPQVADLEAVFPLPDPEQSERSTSFAALHAEVAAAVDARRQYVEASRAVNAARSLHVAAVQELRSSVQEIDRSHQVDATTERPQGLGHQALAMVKGPIDLSGRRLGSVSLADLHLHEGSRLAFAHLVGGDLRGLECRGIDLSRADLAAVRLEDARLPSADLRGARLVGGRARGAVLPGADLRGCDLRSADLQGADLRGARFGGTKVEGVRLRGAQLAGADLSGVDLTAVDLRGVDLEGVDLRGALLSPRQRAAIRAAGHPHGATSALGAPPAPVATDRARSVLRRARRASLPGGAHPVSDVGRRSPAEGPSDGRTDAVDATSAERAVDAPDVGGSTVMPDAGSPAIRRPQRRGRGAPHRLE